ncbi:MAG TPA: TonB-dependent receptor [Gemmatimonadales bacterium]|nr:TonB-dependent receptor [Gemmatimonadales bacterium]
MTRNSSGSLRDGLTLCGILAFSLLAVPAVTAAAQETGTVAGTVTRVEGGALASVSVTVAGTGQSTVTGTDGKYTLRRVPAGPQTIVFRWLGYRPTEVQVSVQPGATVTADATLEAVTISLGEIVVEGASRAPERITEAPAAISVVPQEVLQNASVTGQAPLALQTIPGVDVTQSGVNDFNVNARGFNSTLNRRVLVLQDGRDLAIAFLGSQEWNGLTQPLEDLGKVEMVRGPGSALYGANAFSGVVNITTPTARELLGSRLTIAGGELETFRIDGRHASVFADGRLGFRVNGGYNRSDTYSRSRTRLDGTALQDEYEPATDEPVPFNREVLPLAGQTTDAAGNPVGDRDPLENTYGAGRLDYYLDNGSVLSVDGGAAQVKNEIFVTGIGRVQIRNAIKPFVRAAWAADRFNIFGFWNSRTSLDPQLSLTSGIPIEERSDIFHFEGQNNWNFQEDRGRVVYGASYRNTKVNTSGTLMNVVNDDRSDDLYSAYGQVEYKVVPQVRVVGALRFDDGDLIEGQASPKAAVVYSPTENHSFRVSVNRAFQTPNYSEFFLQVPVAAPTAAPRTLESSIEAYYAAVRANIPPPLIADLTITDDLPWQFSPATNALALGNAALDVEKVTGWEIGYKGILGDNVYVTADAYINELTNFVTDLLPGVNPAYPSYGLTDEVNVPAELAALDARLAALGLPANHPLRAPIPLLQGGHAQLEAGTRIQGGNALATLPGGSRAIVLSYTNAGEVTERGVELGLGYQFTPEIRGDVSFTGFSFDVRSQAVGDQLVPNTPSKKATFSLSYAGAQGFDGNVTLRLVDGYAWAAGVFQGYVPASEFLNVSAGYRINNYVRLHATATNLFDQQRFQMYGGSVIGRRVLGGVTGTF